MTRPWVLVVVTSCIVLTAATSMDDGFYSDGEAYQDDRQPRDYYPTNTWDSENYPNDEPYDQFGDQNDLQLEFNGNLKVYGNNRGPTGRVGKLYKTLTGYNDGDGTYDGRDGGYDGGYDGNEGREGGYYGREGGY